MDLTTATFGGVGQTAVTTRKYQPILEIGSGGMSRVYLAVVRGPAGFNKFQVVKWLLPSLASDPDFLNMFLEEARLSARLNHTNVVQINEVGFDGDHHFMAMEYLEGQSLESLVRRASRQGGLPLELHLHVLAEAAAGLHYAHEFADLDGRALNVVHRDVSPHNVFVTYQGQVKVLDFGIAKAADSSLHTRTGMLKGKVAYMAPEQLRQSRELDRRADLFALGVMLWQAIAGRRLWQNMSDLEVFQQLNTRQIPSLREAKPDAPEALVRICERALSFDVEGRQATAAEFGDALEAYLAGEGRRANGRELGTFISNLFAAKRAEVQALIESALSRRPESLSPAAHLGPNKRPENSLPRPSQPYSATAEGFSGEVLRVSQPLDSALLTLPAPPPEPSFGARPPAGRLWLWPTAIALMLSTSAAAFFAVNRSVRPRPELASVALAPGVDSTAAEAPSAPAAPSAAPQQTHLRVEATPSNARLFVDNVPLSSNPGTATFVRDGLPHRIGAEAHGFVSEAKVIPYDKGEEVVSFQLQRERKAAVWRPSGAPPRPTAPATAPAAPPAGQSATPPAKPAATPKTHQLDRDSPWP